MSTMGGCIDSKCLIWASSVREYSLKECPSQTDPSSPQGDCSFPRNSLSLFGEDGPTGTVWQKRNEKMTVRSFVWSPGKDSDTLSAPTRKIPKDQNWKSLSYQKVNPEGKPQSANSPTGKTDIIFQISFHFGVIIDKEVNYCRSYSNTNDLWISKPLGDTHSV